MWLSDERKAKLKTFSKKNGVNQLCPRCSEKELILLDGYFNI